MDSPAVYVEAAVNGARSPADHAALPVDPAQLAAAAVAVFGVGAQAVHLHPKTPDGQDSLSAPVVAAAVDAVRAAVPGLPLGVTTGFWALPDVDARLAAVQAWETLPDFASVNWHEPGSPELARLLLAKGIGVEAGIFHAEAARSWAESDVAQRCLRVMIELGPDADTATADGLIAILESAQSPSPILLHGLDDSCWPLLEHAGRRGLQTRIGLEDTLRMPDGSTAPDNAALVGSAVALLNG